MAIGFIEGVGISKINPPLTAEPSDVLLGRTFSKDGKVILTGTALERPAQTIIPSTVNQVIASGQYLSGIQTIKGSPNLVASNIKKGVNIFGVTGNYSDAIRIGFNQDCIIAYDSEIRRTTIPGSSGLDTPIIKPILRYISPAPGSLGISFEFTLSSAYSGARVHVSINGKLKQLDILRPTVNGSWGVHKLWSMSVDHKGDVVEVGVELPDLVSHASIVLIRNWTAINAHIDNASIIHLT